MAIYGVGSMYEGKYDMTDSFIQNSCACIGWDPADAPPLYSMLRKVGIGDFIYIKSISRSTQELIIKAIGIVLDDNVQQFTSCQGHGLNVNWLWTGEERVTLTPEMYKNNVFNNTFYEEFNKDIQIKVLNLAVS